ncbi:hypothetical protein SAMN05444162_4606 [Paenibacillaceae bacterium GAS479]|nr:hypothetical protein SAMN05444162_4606 [Paenibacillaceae bacterium GAS479]
MGKASSLTDWSYLALFGIIMLIILIFCLYGFKKLMKSEMDEPDPRVREAAGSVAAAPQAAAPAQKSSNHSKADLAGTEHKDRP